VVALSLPTEALLSLIRHRLLNDCRLAGQSIDVAYSDGCISLVGMVDAPELKKLAVELISGLIGVGWVKDELVVRICKQQDEQALGDSWLRP
jgi:osmotically-inducible protein OsmY